MCGTWGGLAALAGLTGRRRRTALGTLCCIPFQHTPVLRKFSEATEVLADSGDSGLNRLAAIWNVFWATWTMVPIPAEVRVAEIHVIPGEDDERVPPIIHLRRRSDRIINYRAQPQETLHVVE